jgi:hypothetical protein
MISHPGRYIFSGMILCREQFVPSENKVLALTGWEEKIEDGVRRAETSLGSGRMASKHGGKRVG